MQNYYNMIKTCLKRSNFLSTKHDINNAFKMLKDAFHTDNTKEYIFKYQDFLNFVKKCEPFRIFYYKCYQHPLISEVILYLTVERLYKKELEASIREIHALCFDAQQRLDKPEIADETHAVNYVIRLFSIGSWEEPYDFLEFFPEYHEQLENLNEEEEDNR